MMAQTELKRLKDYPLDEWMEAADGCDLCGERAWVKVTWVDESGDYGEAYFKTPHRPDCPNFRDAYESWDDPWVDYPDEPRETPKPVPERREIAGWEWSERTITLAGREWTTLKARANIGPCLNCMKLVVGVPLILWPSDGKVELDFCFSCAAELGILNHLKGGRT